MNEARGTLSFHDCCNEVIKEVRIRIESGLDLGSLNYAHSYALVGLQVGDDDAEAQRVQALYLRSNLSSWRGPVAKVVKAALDNFGKRKGIRT